ncbi:MAG: methyl-accepting chemotaxis protein [Gammaproteobacteria bacterium]|jgi:methyl-accepting chemotaxis protein|nr:methyl-accepting chemotaxis protein [Gammaproteobacteria bacterium]
MKVRDYSIATKIIISSSVSLILVILTALWTYYLSNEVHSLTSLAKVDGIILARAAQKMDLDVIRIQQKLTQVSATRDSNNTGNIPAQAEKSYQSLLSGLSIFEDQYRKKNDKEKLQAVVRLQQQVDEYYRLGINMASAYVEEGTAAGNKIMPSFNRQAEILSAAIKPLAEYHYSIMSAKLDDVSGALSRLMKGELIVFMLIGLSIITAAFIILRMLTAHMRKSQAIIEKLAKGELIGQPALVDGKDEMGKLMGALGDLHLHLQVIIGGVNNTSDQIRDTANEISTDNVNLSELIARQTITMHETAGSMIQITRSVQDNAENAEQASELANNATEVAREGALAITNTIGSMGQVDASSKKISEITAVIDSIAFQTNLLALNASVEAARAGDGGRGFAVVANEVRNLAQRSAASAKEIKQLIEESSIRVDAFSQQVDASGEALGEIVGAVRQVSDVVEKIAQASREQSHNVVEVNRAISDMNDLTENNNDAATEAANFSTRLKNQAEHLSNLMNFFKVSP